MTFGQLGGPLINVVVLYPDPPDLMTRLRLLERNDAAWQDEDYALVMDGLAEEFELEERLEQVSRLSGTGEWSCGSLIFNAWR